MIRVAVVELPDNRDRFEMGWAALIQNVDFSEADVLVLPELPASPWFGLTSSFDQPVWDRVVARHDELIANLGVFGNAIVVSSRAATVDGHRRNIAFVWSKEDGAVDLHAKAILPEEPGFHEQSWYQPGPLAFEPVIIRGLPIGVLLCSELMATEQARRLGQAGARIIAVPRASGDHARWEIAARMAAIASGAFVLSSNRTGLGSDGKTEFGGRSMIIDPDGTILNETGRDKAFATAAIDLRTADDAQATYPRYLDYGPS
jgi:predicted amidohydrolase